MTEALETKQDNAHASTVDGFGREWTRFDNASVSERELRVLFEEYFAQFPWDALPPNAVGADVGCGSGRWARFVAPRVGRLHCVDASEDALGVARRNLATAANVEFHRASVDAMPFAPASLDFAYSLGVLHHVPDTLAGIRACVRALKPGAPFLVYLYYALDNRPWWFRAIWRASDAGRRLISTLPPAQREWVADGIAASVYWPLARASAVVERLGASPELIPLSAYRHRSFYVMRNDALDRFGTQLEQRFTRAQVESMLREAGLVDVRSWGAPYWCAVGVKPARDAG